MKLPWPIRSVLAGAAGTATMTLAYAAERRLRPAMHKSLDYDDSLVPGQIVAGIRTCRPSPTRRRTSSDSGCAGAMAPRSESGTGAPQEIRGAVGSAAFGATLMTATLTMSVATAGRQRLALAAERDRDRLGPTPRTWGPWRRSTTRCAGGSS